MSMDITKTIEPRSDQANADDFLTGPRTFTIEKVTRGSDEQPVDIHLIEFPGRPFKPGKSMRRVLVAAWGPDASTYVGRRLTLYCDPDITFGRDKVGGIRISELSHIDKPLAVALTVTRGRRSLFTVKPLAAPAERDWRAAADALDDLAALADLWREAPTDARDYITQRAATVRAGLEP